MQKWLVNIDILIYLTHNEGKSVMDERFIKTLKAKINKNRQLMIANLILVISIIQYTNAIKKLRRILKLLNLKLMIESELLTIRIFLVMFTLKIGQKKIFIIDSAVKTNSWTNKIEDLNGENIIGIFIKKNCC